MRWLPAFQCCSFRIQQADILPRLAGHRYKIPRRAGAFQPAVIKSGNIQTIFPHRHIINKKGIAIIDTMGKTGYTQIFSFQADKTVHRAVAEFLKPTPYVKVLVGSNKSKSVLNVENRRKMHIFFGIDIDSHQIVRIPVYKTKQT